MQVAEETPAKARKRGPGRPFQKGGPGGPGRPALRTLIADPTPIGLTEAGLEALQLIGGQLRALRKTAEERELTETERGWMERLVTMEREALRVRVQGAAMLLAHGQAGAEVARAINGELPRQALPAKEGDGG